VRVAAEVGGRVVDSALVEGEPVAAGAPLVRIDPADYEIALKQARAAIYPAVWGIGQLFTGAWSDRIGRKGLIVWGMWIQAGGIALTATLPSFAGFAAGGVLLGIGTAC
jgi:MFS family permease